MNRSLIPPLTAMLFALLLAACTGNASPGEPPLQGARIGGPFTLTDQNGRSVSERAFEGKYRLIYFGYSYCPDVCPVDLQVIGQGMRAFEKEHPDRAANVQPIFITVDPERDTPAVLKEYVAAFHPRLIGLTGSKEQIEAAKKGFGIYSAKRAEGGSSEYLVDHSRMAILFGPKGEPIAMVPHDGGAEAVAEELERWVR